MVSSCRRGYPTASSPTALEAIQFVAKWAFERWNRDRPEKDKLKDLNVADIKAYLLSHDIKF